MPGVHQRVPAVARLRYVSDAALTIRRVRKGTGFGYLKRREVIRDAAVLERITSLVLPPAWKDVHVCSVANGHLQATGRDARGRKQYLYHSEWRRIRDQQKYAHVISFAATLPKIRRRVRRDLKKPGLTKDKVLAAVVRLLERSAIRIGNEEYARANHSFGLTTLRVRHVRISGETIRFRFRGKSGKEHDVSLADARLARVVARCQDIPGQELFQYLDENGRRHRIESGDVNTYLRKISGGDFTAKDFRTWIATVQMVSALNALPRLHSKADARRNINAAIQVVAARMGNTAAICRKCYVHPAIIDAYVTKRGRWQFQPRRPSPKSPAGGLNAEEAAVLRLLQQAGATVQKKT
jgi:DNA topoisomerase-1